MTIERAKLQTIAIEFGLQISDFQKAKNGVLSEVYLGDDKYILRSRVLLSDTIQKFLAEELLLEQLGKCTSFEFPKFLRAKSGDKYVIDEKRLWTAYPIIVGDIPVPWWELHKLDAVLQKNIFMSLRRLHDDSRGKLQGDFKYSFNFLKDIRNRLSSMKLSLSSQASARVTRALEEINNSEDTSSKSTYFIHGDYHPGNIIFEGQEPIGFIDTDWIRPGHYLEDVAYTTMMFMRDYRKSSFEFNQEQFDLYCRWYGLDLAALPMLKEYILLYCLFDVHIFENITGSSEWEFRLNYQQTMAADILTRF